jgi:hypothetical protein
MDRETVKALIIKLREGSSGALVGRRVFRKFVPPDTAMPYIFVSLNAGSENNRQARRSGDYRYLVKAVDVDPASADAVAAAIQADLHEQSLTVDAPFACYRSQRLTIVDLVESVERRQYYHSGAIYRLRISQEF